jgi:hypothetical protein
MHRFLLDLEIDLEIKGDVKLFNFLKKKEGQLHL